MGKLLSLELFNFKSYKGHHVMHFGDSYFTSVIGPNGSGKSNSMDAISFVLGIKSSHLRSTHLRDLVYRGRVLKHSKINADGTATEDAEDADDVEAGAEDEETSTQRNDPQTAWVMAVYEDDAGEEQRWKRSITSSGVSEYRINDRVANAKQYNEALEAENILIKARNFLVFQGDVETIANQNPKDLTRLIEQISGSLEFKADYDRLKQEKENADDQQRHKLDQRRGINGEIKQYKEAKDELDRFEQLRDEKDEAVVNHFLWNLYHFQRTIEDSTEQIQKHQDELKEFRRNVKGFEEKLDHAKREQAKASRDVSKIEREIKRKEKDVEGKDNELVPVDEKLDSLNAGVQKYDTQKKRIVQDRDLQQKSADQLQNQLNTVQRAQKRWEDEWRDQQQQTGRELSEQDLEEYNSLKREVYRRSGNDQIKLDNTTRQLKTDEETVNSLKSKVDSTQSQVSALEAEISDSNERKAELAGTVKSTSKEVDGKKKAINAIISERERTNQKRRELDEKLLEVLRKLSEAQGYQRESRKEAEQRETVAQMKRIFPGVKGMVHTLCKPKQRKYEAAMATALGRHWDSIVVDSEKTAKECIQYLKDQRAGQATFVPLDTVIHQQANSNLRGMHQGMRLAIDTIDYDPSLERAMGYACGNAIVTDTLEIAKHLCYERKVDAKAVTLEGTVIHKGGNMTGGENPHEKKRRFEDSEVENLRNLSEKFRADIEALPRGHKRESEEEQLQSELTGLEQKLKWTQDELKTTERNIASKTKELQHAQRQLNDVQPKYDEQAAGVETLRAQLEDQRGTISRVEEQIFGNFCRRLGFNSIHDYERQQGSMQDEANAKKNEFASQTSRLLNQLNFEKQRLADTQRRLARTEDQAKRSQEQIDELQQQRATLAGEKDELEAEIEQFNEQLVGLRAEHDERSTAVSEARREVQNRSKSVEKTNAAITDLETQINKSSTGRYTMLRQCKLDNIDLPLEPQSRKIDALPQEDAVLQQQGEEDEDAMDVDGEDRAPSYNDYGIHIDFSALDEDLKEDDDCEDTLTDKIATLTASMEKMAPNMRSADRLEQTSERLKNTERDFNDARKAARSATKAFEDVKQERKDRFMKAYEHIAEQIGPVYRELTKTMTFPLGGKADLNLEDDEEPYNAGVKYSAMPPLKRYRDMEHLSGGEKTMAALALLFAVHTFAPSPFFVLDEVDAALDNNNTAQLANYVRDHAGPGMQFVVISLKTGLFQNSETLVGVMRDQGVNSSRALTLDVSLLFSSPFPTCLKGCAD